MTSPPGRFRIARLWSNAELKQVAPHLGGRIVNVSGADDEDKDGGHYRDYFTGAREYAISNWTTDFRGYKSRPGEVLLDLEAPEVPTELKARYDTAFCHTTLEHVFDVGRAVATLCTVATDHVVVVVPFAQVVHGPPSFGDYWRFTPMGLSRLFEAQGWSITYLSGSPDPDSAIYLFAVASAHLDKASALREAASLGRGIAPLSHASGRELEPTGDGPALGQWIGARPTASAGPGGWAVRGLRNRMRRGSTTHRGKPSD